MWSTRLKSSGARPLVAQMMLLFGYHRPDVFSFGDAGLRRGLIDLYGLEKEGLEESSAPLLESGSLIAVWPHGSCGAIWDSRKSARRASLLGRLARDG